MKTEATTFAGDGEMTTVAAVPHSDAQRLASSLAEQAFIRIRTLCLTARAHPQLFEATQLIETIEKLADSAHNLPRLAAATLGDNPSATEDALQSETGLCREALRKAASYWNKAFGRVA